MFFITKACVFCIFVVIRGEGQSLESLWRHPTHQSYIRPVRPFLTNLQAVRLCLWPKNIAIQMKLNQNRTDYKSAWYGPTKFFDLSPKEFSDLYLSSYKEKPQKNWAGGLQQATRSHVNLTTAVKQFKLPKRVDWRDQKIVTGVRDQGRCGGCWAFSSIEAVESMNAKATGNLIALSVQEMLDCSSNYKNLYGCKGGDICTALGWLIEKKVHIETEKQYPTTDVRESCKVNPQKVKGVQIKNYTCMSYVNVETQLLHTLATVGPVAVSVDATTWSNYQGGIIQYHCGGTNNHAVLIVGYDLTGSIPYYIVKNSWGTSFGHDGYLYVKAGNNVCGIVKEVAVVGM